MSKEFVFTSTLDHSVERVHGALTSEDFWNSRLAASQTGVGQLEVGSGPGTFRAKSPTRSTPLLCPRSSGAWCEDL